MLERVAGIEPAPLAWKAKVLPLNYTRIFLLSCCNGGGRRIRTFEAFASDLQSDPFDRSGIPPLVACRGQHKPLHYSIYTLSLGAGTRSRTRDLLITSQLLYQLSYTGFFIRGAEV